MQEIQEKITERAILVNVVEDKKLSGNSDFDPLEELRLLADTAGAQVVGTLSQIRSHIDSTYFIGKGKADELKDEVEKLEASSVIFNNDLSPAQVSNLQKLLGVKVIDRSGLILDIFALRARTREAKTQVELAQLKYMLPRLTRQWTHLSRQVGGIGTRGPGETQLEVDRRRIRDRIAHLSQVLDTISKRHSVSRKKRRDCFKVSLVGYTNAGKSTLLNALSGADVPVENKLFKTLDSITRMIRFKSTPDILLSDTVGFIRNLPHDLIASFQTTLDEVKEADLLLHVIDITNPEWENQIDVVKTVLSDMGASETDTVMVFNKIDMVKNEALLKAMQSRFSSALFVSAHDGTGIEELKEKLKYFMLRGQLTLTMAFGPHNNKLLSEIYRYGNVIDSKENGDTVNITFNIPVPIAQKLGIPPKNDN
ncbi:MAG: GTPase HflX [Candidatus Latescibacteria bacterium]|nr:GTPase HflX [Candidatus Latescibacterota bacterium]